CRAEKRGDFLDDRDQRYGAAFGSLLPTKNEDLLDQIPSAIACLASGLQAFHGRVLRVQILTCQLDVANNGTQQIAEVMSDAASQSANGLQLLGLAQLPFQPSTLANIPDDGGKKQDVSG